MAYVNAPCRVTTFGYCAQPETTCRPAGQRITTLKFVTAAVTLWMAYRHAPMGASVIVSKFSDRLNAKRADESIRSVSTRAAQLGHVGESTLYPYFRDGHPRPTMRGSSGARNGAEDSLRRTTDLG